jgi:hypothetical protein
MNFKDYLNNKGHISSLYNEPENIEQICEKNICTKRDFKDYESFYDFVMKHYELKHLQEHNYIKFVKVMRNIIIINHCDLYNTKINNMNEILLKLSENNILSYNDITKFFYKIESINKILEEKKNIIDLTILNIREIIKKNNDLNNDLNKFKLLFSINNLVYKSSILEKYGKKLKYLVKDYLLWESRFGIDHNLIKANNHKRSYLGLRSESYTNNIVLKYINDMNEIKQGKNNIQYFYEKNIDVIKLFNINALGRKKIKGELDGLIISYDGSVYTIEYIIEVKSSIKATFEDIEKIIYLKKFILNYEWNTDIIYENYVFNKESFKKIIEKPLLSWCIYFCIINDDKYVVEKSNIYFYTVLKILDNNFIQKFYVDKDESIIKEKYNIVMNNMDLINKLFNEWKENTGFGGIDCNIFVGKPSFPLPPLPI